jgi:hypothetical protein
MVARVALWGFVAVLVGLFVRLFEAVRPAVLNGLAALGVVLLVAVPVSAQDRTAIAIGAYITAGFVDAAGTAYCHGAGTCHEVNPVLSPIVDRHGVVAAMSVKGAMHTGISAWLLRDRKRHERRAFWTAVALAGAQLAVDIGNNRRIGRQR